MRYWFVRKTYGYGWTPATWEGWLTLAVYIVVSVLTYFLVAGSALFGADPNALSARDIVIGFVLPFLGYTFLLLLVAYKKGEKPRWQWGENTRP